MYLFVDEPGLVKKAASLPNGAKVSVTAKLFAYGWPRHAFAGFLTRYSFVKVQCLEVLEIPSNVTVPKDSDWREWSAAGETRKGHFLVKAQFLGFDGKKIKVRREDGAVMWMPLDHLSEEDQAWVRKHGT